MGKARLAVSDEFRPEESPIAWFGEMLIAIDRGDVDRAEESRRQLDRLGWRVRRKQSCQDGPTQGGDHVS